MPQITPNLWFDREAEAAARFYASVFPNSKIKNVSYYNDAGPREVGLALVVEFELDGQPFMGINGGPQFPFTEAVSFLVTCKDQAEVDHYWEQLSAGGEEGQCGWLKDKFGVSWQICPDGMAEALSDPVGGARAMQAMLGMKKIDLAALRRAAAAEG